MTRMAAVAASSLGAGAVARGGAQERPTAAIPDAADRKSTRLNSSHVEISYAVFCLKKKTIMSRFLIARQILADDWIGFNQLQPSSSSDFTKHSIDLRDVELLHHHADTDTARYTVAR